MIARLRVWWLGLARRERVMTAGAAAFILLALLFLVAIEPAWKARVRLATELPRLRAQSAEVDALALEANGLKSRVVAAESIDAARAAIEKSLAQASLGDVRVAVLDDRRLSVNAGGVSVSQWLTWAEEAARESRLRIAAARVSRGAARAVVDAEAVFEIAGKQ
jgi:general secretion pathway protein M